MRVICLVGLALGMLVGACGKSSSPASATAPSAQDQIEQNLKAAGQNIKAAATEAASQIKPTLDRAKEEGREAVHSAAVKVAEWTATQPATQP